MSAGCSNKIVSQVADGRVDIRLILVADTTLGLLVKQVHIDKLIMVSTQAIEVNDASPQDYLYRLGLGDTMQHTLCVCHICKTASKAVA
ncbi:MAG: hypothetical protein ACI9ES_002640 [Oceanospirillaceae bacterium]|jgi:hypothetical protein